MMMSRNSNVRLSTLTQPMPRHLKVSIQQVKNTTATPLGNNVKPKRQQSMDESKQLLMSSMMSSSKRVVLTASQRAAANQATLPARSSILPTFDLGKKASASSRMHKNQIMNSTTLPKAMTSRSSVQQKHQDIFLVSDNSQLLIPSRAIKVPLNRT